MNAGAALCSSGPDYENEFAASPVRGGRNA